LPSDGDFLLALRDHAMSSGGKWGDNGVLGLTHPPELEQWSGLSRPSVSAQLERFEAVLDHQDPDGHPVPPAQARRWALHPNAGIVIAVQIGQVSRVAMSDLYGRLAPKTCELDLNELPRAERLGEQATADGILDWAARSIRTLVDATSPEDVVGVCISFAAPVDRDKGVLRAPLSARRASPATAALEEWQLMRARDQLVSRLGWDDVVFLVDNDANLSALAEYVWGAGRWAATRPQLLPTRPFEDVVYVEWSRGIGSGLILNGGLYRGRGVAGEIGHTVITDSASDPCEGCGKIGCLESVAGWNAIFKNALDVDVDRLSPSDSRELSAMLDPGHECHPRVAEAFGVAAGMMARVLGPVIHLLNPQLVVIGGDVGRLAYDLVRAPLLQALNDYTMHPALSDVSVRQSILGADRALRGALALVLLQQKDDPPTLLRYLQRRRLRPAPT
jgi:predicted NBD/HSP70 family sugar kinase